MNLPLSTTSIQNKLQGIIDDVNAMESLKITDGWVQANNETFRLFRKTRHALVLQAQRNGMEVREIADGMLISEDEVIDLLTQPLELPLQVGVMVRSRDPQGNPLRSGSEVYPGAIVVSVDPFVMVSYEADMRWSSWDPSDVIILERAPEHMVKVAMTRLEM